MSVFVAPSLQYPICVFGGNERTSKASLEPRLSSPLRIPNARDFLPFSASLIQSLSGSRREYTFGGHVGKITLAPDDPADEQYLVTFNDGRTSYGFNQEHLKVEQDYNYEVIQRQAVPAPSATATYVCGLFSAVVVSCRTPTPIPNP